MKPSASIPRQSINFGKSSSFVQLRTNKHELINHKILFSVKWASQQEFGFNKTTNTHTYTRACEININETKKTKKH